MQVQVACSNIFFLIFARSSVHTRQRNRFERARDGESKSPCRVWSAAPRKRTDHTQQVNLELQCPRKMIGGNGRKELSEGTQTPGSEEGAIGLLILAACDGARDIHE
ncbi:hypothetical protein I7I50_05030 [Histoplasma capsulatum G186AR]|uniref:Uncharacterized protein n=1 Tax=Ajellomyces capsulatus TaxID=5037 RepID=A0A8H7ZBP2_AJECA|nr:hypothetical protein I7I52_03288 [Histoplasma capsulatum]QSS75774.1 hypothetical protein I7I50_05030 [Histoplasma capsulatum G186AR]